MMVWKWCLILSCPTLVFTNTAYGIIVIRVLSKFQISNFKPGFSNSMSRILHSGFCSRVKDSRSRPATLSRRPPFTEWVNGMSCTPTAFLITSWVDLLFYRSLRSPSETLLCNFFFKKKWVHVFVGRVMVISR